MTYFINIIVMIIFSLNAASGVNIQQALEHTYNTSTQFKEKQEEIKGQHEAIVQALSGWRPKINISGGMSLGKQINSGTSKNDPRNGTPSDSSNNVRDGKIEVRQNLFTGGGTLAQTSKAENSIRQAWASLHSTEQGILFSAIQAYLQLISKYLQVDLYKANRAALYKNLQDAQEKQKVGEETLTQLANAQARFAEADAQLQNAIAELESAKATYERTTSLKAIDKMAKPSPFLNLPQTLEEALEIAIQENPDIIAAHFEHLGARADIDRVTSDLLPNIDLVGSASRQESRGSNHYAHNTRDSIQSNNFVTNQQIILQASIPLYEGGNIRSQRRQALENATQKRIAIDTKRGQVKEQIQQLWRTYLAAKNNIENYHKQVDAAEVGLEGTTQEMNVGTKVLLDVLNARSELLKAQLALVEASKTYCLESYRLLAALGRLTAKHLKLKVDYFDPQSHYQKVRAYF